MVIRGETRDSDDPFPTIARIQTERLNGKKEIATGVFVSPNIFLTAAHVLCTPDRESCVRSVNVRTHHPSTGSFLLNEHVEKLNRVPGMKKHFRVHPDYSGGKNDVAVFLVDGEVDVFAPILTKDTISGGTLSAAFAGVSGWGLSLQGTRIDRTTHAQFAGQFLAATAADVFVQKDSYYKPDTATPTLAEVLNCREFYVSNHVGNERQGPCPGDSGGGIFLGDPEQAVSDPKQSPPSHLLLGLVSHSSLDKPPKGATNAERRDHYSRTDLSVACTNLAHFREWITDQIKDLGGKPATFK